MYQKENSIMMLPTCSSGLSARRGEVRESSIADLLAPQQLQAQAGQSGEVCKASIADLMAPVQMRLQ
jgi:tRNA A58 N-methylase Trm61